MPTSSSRSTLELDLHRYELRLDGMAVRLEKLPMELLMLLAENRYKLVTREAIVERLWGKHVYVDTEQGINTAIRKIRRVLADDPEQPRFVQTVVGKGYRFIGPIAVIGEGAGDTSADLLEAPGKPVNPASSHRPVPTIAAFIAVMLIFIGVLIARRPSVRGDSSRPHLGIASIAVLPLQNLSHEPGQEYLADGMTEALIDSLCKISSLRVISPTSVMQYKASRKSLADIARDLHVDAVVEGSLQRSGDSVRVVAELIDAKTHSLLWSRSFDRDSNNVLMLESELAQDIAGQVRAKLTPLDVARFSPQHFVAPKAHDAYLRGRYLWSKRTKRSVERSIRLYEETIEMEPQHAAAYAAMADSYRVLEDIGQISASEANPRIKAAAIRAVAADPNLAEAHLALADAREIDWDWASAEQEYKRAIELNPGLARAHHWYAVLLSGLKRHDEAISEIVRAVDLEPLSPRLYCVEAEIYYLAGRYDDALRTINSSPIMHPEDLNAKFWKAKLFLRKQNYPAAIANLRAIADSPSRDTIDLALLGYAYSAIGQKHQAVRILGQLREIAKREFVKPASLAIIWVGLGNNDEALRVLQEEYRLHSSFWLTLASDPVFEPLNADVRFQDLLRQVGLPTD